VAMVEAASLQVLAVWKRNCRSLRAQNSQKTFIKANFWVLGASTDN
jgi:hypothetical protein